ncbi:hypothetical protein [Paenibacillus harenae]|uniref:hypothetical protein n=1 Tax=Paenibacillus harenae TaxID=306543 RepID=UPI000402CCAB|nr:hypothetical protein [Paenibacillus harenae]
MIFIKAFLYILGILLFVLGVRGIIIALIKGSAGSFVIPGLLPEGNLELFASIVLVLISLFLMRKKKA